MNFCYHGFRIGFADIVTAFDEKTIGTKVLDRDKLFPIIANAMERFDWTTCRQPGQAYIPISKEACSFVSGGVGKRTQDPEDYVIRVHRSRVGMYLKRRHAASVDNVAVVVYSLAAYIQDPDCSEEERKRIMDMNVTHVLVAVLASCGKPSTLTAHRFVWNLSGGNNEALAWSADEIRQKAKEILEFTSEWGVVAD